MIVKFNILARKIYNSQKRTYSETFGALFGYDKNIWKQYLPLRYIYHDKEKNYEGLLVWDEKNKWVAFQYIKNKNGLIREWKY